MNAPLLQSRPGKAASAAGEWLAPLTGHWVEAAAAYLAKHAPLVRVTVVALRGSAPREPGASMLVDLDGTLGTIGGGRLEWQAIGAARELFSNRDTLPVRIDDLILGPDLGQCCGGRVELWLERLTREDLPWLRKAARRLRDRGSGGHGGDGGGDSRGGGGVSIATDFADGVASHRILPSRAGTPGVALHRSTTGNVRLVEVLKPQRLPLWIFGAGHVGQALIRLLAPLALFDITWVDSRPELLPAGLPDCVTARACAAPAGLLDAAPPGAHYVVLTHDHALDYELCRRILARGDAGWLGLIGSASKSARFRSRLRRDGIGGERLAELICPIGIGGIESKLPAALAIAIAAQLLQRHAGAMPSDRSRRKLHACGASCEACGAERHSVP
jgi:xanthine dehydrogenase accessory factor